MPKKTIASKKKLRDVYVDSQVVTKEIFEILYKDWLKELKSHILVKEMI